MRELKFRAWYNQSQTWVYFTFNQPMTDVAKAIHQNICLNGGIFYQFIGLTDRNGKEIYEGDILQPYNDSGKVVIEFQGGQFFGRNLDKNHPIVETQNRNWFQWEVVGNVHEDETYSV